MSGSRPGLAVSDGERDIQVTGAQRTPSVVHTVSGIDSEASGPSYTVPRLARAVSAHGCATEIVTLGVAGKALVDGVTVVRCPPDPTRSSLVAKLGRSRVMRSTLLESQADIFHTHGLWMMPNVYPGEAARRLGKPFVLAPRGMLGRDPLKYSATAKRIFWAAWQKRAVDGVSCFHATAESEYEDIRAYGLKQPVAVVPNGIDLPSLSDLDVDDALQAAQAEAPFIVSLGRIHPKKGLDRLVAAFALVAPGHPEWRLRIVGPDQDRHAGELERQVAALGLAGRVTIEPPAFGVEKFRLLRQAKVFALSTLHENFGMTVAESLAAETPVISTKGAPWAGLSEHGCGWWIDHGPEAMAAALGEAMALPDDRLAAMGACGRRWMERDYSWQGIGRDMAAVYRWLRDGGEPPDCVRTT